MGETMILFVVTSMLNLFNNKRPAYMDSHFENAKLYELAVPHCIVIGMRAPSMSAALPDGHNSLQLAAENLKSNFTTEKCDNEIREPLAYFVLILFVDMYVWQAVALCQKSLRMMRRRFYEFLNAQANIGKTLCSLPSVE
uniref:Uncharacterized protein n=1 Tax=Glossina pallidipes TaxID=7398 RepID=A0A1B0AHY2_GLOPL